MRVLAIIAGELRASLDREVAERRVAEEEAERLRMERQRLQKARDELASTLLVGHVNMTTKTTLHI